MGSLGDNETTDSNLTRAFCTVMRSEGRSGHLPSWNDFLKHQVGEGTGTSFSELGDNLKAAYGLAKQDPHAVPTFLHACPIWAS